ncbi:MAG TPA: DUF523 domain-containing protein [Planctomycetota bacterium]|jgi:uncharacterized protein YbbK (DUF523 family)|nr:DUF523 domain-containing protein [Planctomycetota bacterium]
MGDETEAREVETVLVSACLLGRHCRYDGHAQLDEPLARDLEAQGVEILGFCPEEEGGLSTPRPPASIGGEGAPGVLDGTEHVLTDAGANVTSAFRAGAEAALAACRAHGVQRAFLKERSPSCGVASTHVEGACVSGRGVTAELLVRAGLEVEGVEGRRNAR